MSIRTVLLVGASSAIARKTAEVLEREGIEPIRWSRQQLPVGETVESYMDGPLPEIPDKLDGLVYFPGTVRLTAFHRVTLQQFQEDWEINVAGFIRILQAALPALGNGTDASVVGITTVAVQTGLGFHASVSQSKGALQGLIRALAAEYAAKGIRFNAVAPSLTESGLTANLVNSDEKRERMGKRHPLGRIGQPQDIAEAIAYLVGNHSSWVTGQVIGVDGGYGTLRQ